MESRQGKSRRPGRMCPSALTAMGSPTMLNRAAYDALANSRHGGELGTVLTLQSDFGTEMSCQIMPYHNDKAQRPEQQFKAA